MRKFPGYRLSIIFAFVFVVLCTISCDKDDDMVSNTPEIVTNLVVQGNWKITYYYDTDHEETSNYQGYNFTFASNNVLTASNGTNTYLGTWSVTDSNSNDDNMSDLHFNIGFSSPANFAELTEDWAIIEKSNTVLKLRHISGGNGGTDFLTFTKN